MVVYYSDTDEGGVNSVQGFIATIHEPSSKVLAGLSLAALLVGWRFKTAGTKKAKVFLA